MSDNRKETFNKFNEIIFKNLLNGFEANKEGFYFVRVSDIAGRILLNEKRTATEGINGGDINHRTYTTGSYTLTITKGSEENHIRFEVNR